MLTLSLTALVLVQQDPIPTSGILMDIPLAATSATTSQMTYSEADEGPVPMPEVDSRFNLATMVPLPSGADLRVNSFSRGTGATFSRMLDPDHVHLEVDSGGWSFILFSVTGTGWDPGSIYAAEDATSGGLDGDVFSYVATGSDTYFPDDQVGEVLKVREGTEIGIGALSGIDSYISGYGATTAYSDDADESMGGPRFSFYFTLVTTNGPMAYDSIPIGWGPSSGPNWRKPSTIFVNHWHDSTGWSGPTVWKDADDLDLDPDTVIDALSVMDPEFIGDPYGTNGIEVLLSTANADLDEQVWICGTWRLEPLGQVLTYRGPLKDIAGERFVETALGLTKGQQGVVTSCSDDPGADGLNPFHHQLRLERTALLTPLTPPGNAELHFSLHQTRWPENATFTRYRATLQGFASPFDASAELRVSGVQVPILTVDRRPGRGVDKQSIELQIPFLGNGPEPINLVWFVLDRNGQPTGMTHTFQVRAR